ncbi:UvrD-helicase domain-containing protein [Flavobacterium sp. ov086]|uniref:UvrD-helicase domain-containing protein n=1 Tax=Flavobacterium sp. ov086 TaxID=1761785 RepID=UPI000B66C407|nr:ATP-dependent helicase [Flavobacterium sp. ov086]SNR97871.1 Superfamily I DNA or RNA helicase [Flavobacterium sp. ov086]
MYGSLSESQKIILDYNDGTVVVKACPGSGKTYSLAARISRLLKESQAGKKGLCVISFTNIACMEIEDRLANNFSTIVPLKHPHFFGTIDSFINTFIFLPFGHLIMGCDSRPELVGEPHAPWSVKRSDWDYDQYFDKTTFDADGMLIPIAPYQAFSFRWNYYNKDGRTVNGNILRIMRSKNTLFKKGYANQSDANYLSLKVLQKYPVIAQNLAQKFSHFMIDECQDTNDVHMKIIDILNEQGGGNIMLVGDRDQSIFEWNDAKPELFDQKYNLWDKILLNQNRRSSQLICNFIKNLSSFEEINAVNEKVKDSAIEPSIYGYITPKNATAKDKTIITLEQSVENFKEILNNFLDECRKNKIPIDKENTAVLYRGNSSSKYLGLRSDLNDFETIPWITNHHHVKNIIKGRHMYENGSFNKGYKLMEKGYFEALMRPSNPQFYCNTQFVADRIYTNGIKQHRKEVFSFIECLPASKDKTLNEWVEQANKALREAAFALEFRIESQFGNIAIDDYFGEDLNSEKLHPFYFGTVHSVKGKTFQAVLLLLGKKAVRKNYATIITSDLAVLNANDLEELRIVYVALSRPEILLQMAVPDSDLALWTGKMN